MKITVPATSANIGPGFDSCGIAVNRYLTIDLITESETWLIDHSLGEEIPCDKSNLLIATALNINPNLPPHKMRMTSDIPLTRGLGSSSSAIVAGIELANQLGKMNLSDREKVAVATRIEGHPDNVAPAVLGDFVVASFVDNKVYAVRHRFPDCSLVAFIPDETLSTEKSRNVLPDSLKHKEAVAASSIANVMIGAVLNNDLALAGKMIERDLFHEKYRCALVPFVEPIRAAVRQKQAYATYLSGAGPAVMVIAPKESENRIADAIRQLPFAGQAITLEIDRTGVAVVK